MATKAVNDNLEQEQTLTLDERRRAFGINLRDKREESGISIISLSQSTRISVPFITALEAGDFVKLPGYVFGRGFVRNICKITETDESFLLQEFSDCWEGERPLSDIVTTRKNESHKWEEVKSSINSVKFKSFNLPKIPKFSLRDRAIVGSVVAAVITIGLIFVATENLPNVKSITAKLPSLSPSNTEKPLKIAATEVQKPLEDSTSNLDSSTSESSEVKSIAVNSTTKEASQENSETSDDIVENITSTETKSITKQQGIEILVKEAVRIKIQIDQQNNITKELTPDTYKYSFDDVARLLIFDASAVEIKFNGKDIGNLGKKGRVRRISFKANSTQI